MTLEIVIGWECESGEVLVVWGERNWESAIRKRQQVNGLRIHNRFLCKLKCPFEDYSPEFEGKTWQQTCVIFFSHIHLHVEADKHRIGFFPRRVKWEADWACKLRVKASECDNNGPLNLSYIKREVSIQGGGQLFNKDKFHCVIVWPEREDSLGRVIERVSYKDHGWYNADSQNWRNRVVVFTDPSGMWVRDFISERANNKQRAQWNWSSLRFFL